MLAFTFLLFWSLFYSVNRSDRLGTLWTTFMLSIKKSDFSSMNQPLIRGANASKKTNQRSKSEKVLRTLRIISAMVAHLIAIAFPAFIIYLASPGSSLFSWHPTLMTIAFTTLMVEAILVFSPESSLLFRASRKTKVTVHWILQCSCVLCALIGFVVIFYNKYERSKSHFTSWHGIFGLITVIYIVVQASCGIFLLYPSLVKNWKLVQLKTYHATFGLLGFTLACCTIALGLFSNWFTGNVSGFTWYLSMFCVGWLTLVIMNQVTTAYLPKTRKPAI
ncbi:transmembrane reductase CYB561D2-like isoform X1 [Styela clava]